MAIGGAGDGPLRHGGRVVLALIGLAGLAGLIGCSGAHGPGKAPGAAATSGQAAGRACGTAKTPANVSVVVVVARGHVSCATALMVARDYAAAVRSGRAPGNGGGGPVKVNAWTCQGFPTPTVLRTGKTSKCTRAGDEILEILPAAH